MKILRSLLKDEKTRQAVHRFCHLFYRRRKTFSIGQYFIERVENEETE